MRVVTGTLFRKHSAEQTWNRFCYTAKESAHSETSRGSAIKQARPGQHSLMQNRHIQGHHMLQQNIHVKRSTDRCRTDTAMYRDSTGSCSAEERTQIFDSLLLFLFHGRHSEHCYLTCKGSERNSKSFLCRGIASDIAIYCFYSVLHGIILLSEISYPLVSMKDNNIYLQY